MTDDVPTSPPPAPLRWTPSYKAPARAVSLDSAASMLEDDAFNGPPPGSASDTSQPAHAICKTKTRSYTSPHLLTQRSVSDDDISGDKENSATTHNALPVISIAQHGLVDLSAPSASDINPVDVFLAGSCNPTTWRRDIAIPLLDVAKINYFNPQVDEWYEALMLEETRAKEGAKIILMVIDSATRSIVCINESVEYICRGRRVILVVQNIPLGTVLDGVQVTAKELADLNGARECLRRLALRRGIRLYDDIGKAVAETVACLVEENPKRFAPEMPRLRKRSSIILNEWAGLFRPRRNTSRSWSSTSLFSLVSSTVDENDEYHGEDAAKRSSAVEKEAYVKHSGTTTSGSRGGSVYLGGNLQSTSWREKVAIPRLQSAGISFYIPFQDYLSVELQRILTKQQPSAPRVDHRWQEVEAERERAELILFVIPDRTRSIAAMTEAVELICNHLAMFLVIEPLEEGCLLDDGVHLVGREFKDVARARAYLQEMAERHHVEVYESVSAAVEGIIQRLHQ